MRGWDSDFELFVEQLKLGINKELPGFEAHYKLLPPNRLPPDFEEIESKNPRQAGVLALFYPVNNVPHVVLMKRNVYPGVHSGQISFPGGQKEQEDADLVRTALRETHEEIGVQPHEIEVLGKLTRVFIPPSNFLVQPVIGFSQSRPAFVPHFKEVETLLEIPFSAFAQAKNMRETTVEARGTTFLVPAFIVENEVIWGATAMMISEIVHLLHTDGR